MEIALSRRPRAELSLSAPGGPRYAEPRGVSSALSTRLSRGPSKGIEAILSSWARRLGEFKADGKKRRVPPTGKKVEHPEFDSGEASLAQCGERKREGRRMEEENQAEAR